MSDQTHTIRSPEGDEVTITVRRDKRLKKSARWVRERDGSVLLRVPHRIRKVDLRHLLADVEKQLARQQKTARRRTDDDLQARAEHLNRTCFNGEIQWNAIRWVGNMTTRLGSCTTGGSTDGHIRVSDKIKAWPQWVIDYVIAHELAHRVHPNHSSEFWAYLEAGYPKVERARGFIEGIGFAQGLDFDVDDA